MWKEKLGNYLIDISKYVLTGVVISSFFKDFGDTQFLVYGLGVTVSVSLLALVHLTTLRASPFKRSLRESEGLPSARALPFAYL